MRDLVWMPDGVGDRNGTTLRYPTQSKAIDAGGVNDGLQISDEVLKQNIRDLTI